MDWIIEVMCLICTLSVFMKLQEVALHELKSPTLVIIGAVVALSPGWHMAAASDFSLQDGRSYDPILISTLLARESDVQHAAVGGL